MIEWLIYAVPWWVWAAVGLTVALVIHQTFGFKAAAVAVVVAIAGVFQARARQQGWKDAQARGERDARAIIERANEVRRDADLRNAGDRLREDDGYRRD